MVKPKTGILRIFTERRGTLLAWLLPVLSLLTFISSLAAVYPHDLVEDSFAHGLFPRVSHLSGLFADAIPIAWLDILIPAALILLVVVIRGRRWRLLLNVAAILYLTFFWTWGLNYHRRPLASKLQLDNARMKPEAMELFAKRAAAELNRLYAEKQREPYDEAQTRVEAARRVRRVVEIIDGLDWRSAERIKTCRICNPWFHAAGIDGVFNPIAHEPVVSNTVLDVERPFVISHELAHVRGYPDEGDANVIATFATLMSGDPAFQYSGWLNLWLYLRTRDLETMLDPGPRADLQRMFERARAEQIAWINDFQTHLLDIFLKANSIDEGVRSYSRVVLLAAGTEDTWNRYR